MHVLNQMKHQGLIESASQSPGESSMTKPGTAWCPPVVRWFSPLTIDISTTKPSEIEVFFYQPCHLGGTTLYHKPTGHLCKIAIPSYIHHISYVQRYPTYIHRYIHTYINRISYIHISILFQLPPRTFCHQK